MSITKTLFTGVTGLSTHASGLGVVGDNIANVNTVGYKTERAVFSDLLGRSMLATNQSGSGVQMSKITRTFSQGTFLPTDSPTDLAINGKGFFIVNGSLSGVNGNFYSRAGMFTLDNSGNLVNPQGYKLQGYVVNSDGVLDIQLGDLNIANSVLPPKATTSIEVFANLDSTSTVNPGGAAFLTTSPGTTSNFSTAVTVYDSLGSAHRVDVYFRKTASGPPADWEYHALVDGGDITGGTAGVAVEMAAGDLEFTSDGWLNTETATTSWDSVGGATPTFLGASGQAVTFDFGESIADGGNGRAGTTQYASSSSIRSQEQSGYSTGELAGVGVEGNGNIMAIYSNGEQRMVGQVALATFKAEEELARAGEGLWLETEESGAALVGGAASGAAGSVTSAALEQSTVDLAGEFVNLIAYQRGFQANSRTITTADQLYTEIVNLKR